MEPSVSPRPAVSYNQAYIREYGPILLASIVLGIIGGLGAVLFRNMIRLNQTVFFDGLLPHISLYVYGYNVGAIALPVLGALIVGPLIYRYAREAKGHGVPEVIEAVHTRGGVIRPIVACVKILVSSVTIGSGGSAGREGPIVQIGAVFGSVIGQRFFSDPRYVRLLVCCGVSAGVGATFHAPLGGAIFAMEVIAVQNGLVSAVPILLAAVVGDVFVSAFFGVDTFARAVDYQYASVAEVPIFIVAGVLFGLISCVWATGFYRIEHAFDRLRFHEAFKPVLGGLAVGVLGMLLFGKGIMGVGYETITEAIEGKLSLHLLLLLGVVKIISTGCTIGSGGSGGIFSPSLFIGAMFGGAIGLTAQRLFPGTVDSPAVFIVIGMGAVFAGGCRAPVTALIMIPEMTNNHHLLLPMTIVTPICYIISSVLMRNSMYLTKIEHKGIKINFKENVLRDVRVIDIMTADPLCVGLDTPLSQIQTLMEQSRHPGFPVVGDDNLLHGFVRVFDLKGLSHQDRAERRVRDILVEGYPRVTPADTAADALDAMVRHEVGRLPVVVRRDGRDHVVGVVSKTDLANAYELLMR